MKQQIIISITPEERDALRDLFECLDLVSVEIDTDEMNRLKSLKQNLESGSIILDQWIKEKDPADAAVTIVDKICSYDPGFRIKILDKVKTMVVQDLKDQAYLMKRNAELYLQASQQIESPAGEKKGGNK